MESKPLTAEGNGLIFNTHPGEYQFAWKENNLEWQFCDLENDPGELHNKAGLNTPDFLWLKNLTNKALSRDLSFGDMCRGERSKQEMAELAPHSNSRSGALS